MINRSRLRRAVLCSPASFAVAGGSALTQGAQDAIFAVIPGSYDRIVFTATSGDGALALVVAHSGNSLDYLPFPADIGAAGIGAEVRREVDRYLAVGVVAALDLYADLRAVTQTAAQNSVPAFERTANTGNQGVDGDVMSVDFRLPWMTPHSGNYDVQEPHGWLAGVLAVAR